MVEAVATVFVSFVVQTFVRISGLVASAIGMYAWFA